MKSLYHKKTFNLQVLGIICLSYFVSTFPLIDYIRETHTLQDVGQNIYNISNRYYYLVHDNSLSFFDYFKTEWLWAYSSYYFSQLMDSPESYFKLIGGFNFFIYSLFIYRKSNFKSIFLLLIPIQIVFLIYQPRLAFGCSLWLLGIMIDNKYIRYFLLIASLMIHNAMFIILGSFFILEKVIITRNSQNIYSLKKAIVFTVILSLLVNIIVGPLISTFTSVLDKGTSSYENETLTSSITSFLFWGIISFLIILDAVKYKNEIYSKLIGVFFSLFPVFSFLLNSGYPYRFLTVGMPFVIISIMNCNGIYKIILLLLYIVFGIYTSLGFYI